MKKLKFHFFKFLAVPLRVFPSRLVALPGSTHRVRANGQSPGRQRFPLLRPVVRAERRSGQALGVVQRGRRAIAEGVAHGHGRGHRFAPGRTSGEGEAYTNPFQPKPKRWRRLLREPAETEANQTQRTIHKWTSAPQPWRLPRGIHNGSCIIIRPEDRLDTTLFPLCCF